jgi:hypothetical protein
VDELPMVTMPDPFKQEAGTHHDHLHHWEVHRDIPSVGIVTIDVEDLTPPNIKGYTLHL